MPPRVGATCGLRTVPRRGFLLAIFLALGSAAPVFSGDEAGSAATPRLKIQGGHARDVWAATFSKTGSHVLTVSLDKTLRLWEVETGREVRTFTAVGGVLLTAALSPDERHVLAGASDGVVHVFSVSTGLLTRTWRAHQGAINALLTVETAQGTRVVTASSDGSARVWNMEGGAPLAELSGQPAPHQHTGRVQALAVRPKGRYVLTGGRDGAAILWSMESGQPMRLFRRADAPGAGVTAAVFEVDGEHVLIGYDDGVVVRYDMQQRVVSTIPAHSRAIQSLALGPDGRLLLSGSTDGTARLFDLHAGDVTGLVLDHPRSVVSTAFSPDGKRMLTVSGRTTRLWDVQTRRELRTLAGRTEPVRALALSPDGEHLAAASAGGGVFEWDLAQGSVTRRFAGHRDAVSTLSYSSSGEMLVTGSEDETVRMWRTDSAKEVGQLRRHAGGVHAVAFSAGGDSFATGGGDQQVLVWNELQPASDPVKLSGHTAAIMSVAFVADGQRLVTGADDTTIRLWDLSTGQQVWSCEECGGSVAALVVAPDGQRILAGSHDGRVRILDTASGQALGDVGGRQAAIHALALSRDGHEMLVGSEDGRARLWQRTAQDGWTEVLALSGHESRVTAVLFSADARFLLTGSEDQTIRVHERETGTERGTLVAFEAGGWAVLDPSGRFDASDAGDVDGLHWVVPSSNWPGVESIALSELKERYYEPGLLAKILGYDNTRTRPVEPFEVAELAPKVEVENQGGILRIRVTNRGAGIGRVVVKINGKERSADSRPPGSEGDAATLEIVEDVREDPRIAPGVEARIEVVAFTADGDLRGRGVEVRKKAVGHVQDARLWAVVAGTSQYAGRGLRLKYASKDATDFAAALTEASKGLFQEAGTNVTVLSDPGREDLLAALGAAKAAKASDIFVLFLAGHGVVYQDHFYYLTAAAESDDLSDAQTRDRVALSSSALTDALNQISANKQVVILDTCASGRFIEQMIGARGGTTSQQRRALDRLKDRTGVYVLAGCAADLQSYEHPRYGQGLLTYGLLLGMRGGSLRNEEFVDVAMLFGFAQDRVPEFAREVGGRQLPLLATPKGSSSFDIGQLRPEARERIRLREPQPYFTRSSVYEAEQGSDVNDIAKRVDQALLQRSLDSQGAQAFHFLDSEGLDDSYRVAGTYSISEAQVAARVRLWRGREQPVTNWIDVAAPLESIGERIALELLALLPMR